MNLQSLQRTPEAWIWSMRARHACQPGISCSSTCIRLRTSAYVCVCQHTSGYDLDLKHARAPHVPAWQLVLIHLLPRAASHCLLKDMSASQCTCAKRGASHPAPVRCQGGLRQLCQHMSAYVSIRQHTSAYVTHPAAVGGIRCHVAVDSPAPHASVFALLY